MRYFLAIIALVLFLTPANAEMEVTSGNFLLQSCNSDNANFSKGLCMGFTDGLAAGLSDGRFICVTKGVTVSQEVLIVKKYLQSHQILLDQPYPRLVSSALREAFPCPKT